MYSSTWRMEVEGGERMNVGAGKRVERSGLSEATTATATDKKMTCFKPRWRKAHQQAARSGKVNQYRSKHNNGTGASCGNTLVFEPDSSVVLPHKPSQPHVPHQDRCCGGNRNDRSSANVKNQMPARQAFFLRKQKNRQKKRQNQPPPNPLD